MKPRIFISLATSTLGGPGKGLVQFLKFKGLDYCEPIFINFVTDPSGISEYANSVRAAGAKVFNLQQGKKFDFSLVYQAEEIIKRERCQILQSHGYKSHVLCALLKFRLNLPWVAFVHGWTAENLLMRCYRILEIILVSMATIIVPVSCALSHSLSAISKSKITVVPNAVDPEELVRTTGRNVRAEFGIPDKCLVAGVVGRLSPEKGQIFFIRALARVRQEFPNVVGLLVGDGQDRSMLNAEVKKFGLENAVIFAGYTQCVSDFYRAIDVLVMPSLSEGMPNVALEAMLFGKPVVASRVGGISEVLIDGQTGFLVSPGDVNSLASTLLQVLGSSDCMRLLGRAGYQRAIEDFSPTNRTVKIMNIYHKILHSKISESCSA